jgi:hypothetical protein
VTFSKNALIVLFVAAIGSYAGSKGFQGIFGNFIVVYLCSADFWRAHLARIRIHSRSHCGNFCVLQINLILIVAYFQLF